MHDHLSSPITIDSYFEIKSYFASEHGSIIRDSCQLTIKLVDLP
jgi:hypothetical protein